MDVPLEIGFHNMVPSNSYRIATMNRRGNFNITLPS